MLYPEKILIENNLKDETILAYTTLKVYETNSLYESVLVKEDKIFNKDEVTFDLIAFNENDKISYKAKVIDKYPKELMDKYPTDYKYAYAPLFIIKYSSYEPKSDIKSVSYNFNTNDHAKLDKEIKKFINNNKIRSVGYNNEYLDVLNSIQMIKTTNFIIYLVLLIICIITITSITNTINSSMELRRSEFAVLKSIGLSNKGFNKMILFESLMLAGKALIFGLLISLCIIFLIIKALLINIDNYGLFFSFIPYKYIIICILSVFFIIYISMILATRKFKKDNIIDAIKEELM